MMVTKNSVSCSGCLLSTASHFWVALAMTLFCENREYNCKFLWYSGNVAIPSMPSFQLMSLVWRQRLIQVCLLFRAPFYYMRAKSPTQMGAIFGPMSANCLHSLKTMFVHVSESEFHSANCSKFAVESDWNSQIFQSVQNFGFFWKNIWFF